MPAQAVLEAVRARQEAGWTKTPVYYPNDQAAPATNLAAFVQVEFPVGGGVRLTLAYDGLHEETGSIRFVVHVRLMTGTDQAFAWAEELGLLFQSTEIFRDAKHQLTTAAMVPSSGLGADVAYYLVTVAVPYRLLYVPIP